MPTNNSPNCDLRPAHEQHGRERHEREAQSREQQRRQLAQPDLDDDEVQAPHGCDDGGDEDVSAGHGRPGWGVRPGGSR
jgi:hypothetical protein